MFAFFIIGFRPRLTAIEPGSTDPGNCPRCGRNGVMRKMRQRNWFTFFFIPVFPVGRGRIVRTCTACGWLEDAFAGPPAGGSQASAGPGASAFHCVRCGGRIFPASTGPASAPAEARREGPRLLRLRCPHCGAVFEIRL